MARALGQHGEDEQAQLAIVEEPAAGPTAATMAAMAPAMVFGFGMVVAMMGKVKVAAEAGVVVVMMVFHKVDIDLVLS
jgi:hypothetical protein